MHTNNERGIALVLALFLTAALSTLGASLMFLAQTETYATMNYRMMSQARYAGEAGVQKASNFLLDAAQYTVPTATGADNLINYDLNASPVTYLGQPVILSATAAQASNYPVAAVQTAFNNAAQGTLTAGNANVTYKAYATLVTMQSFVAYGGTLGVVQTWEISGIGGLTGPRGATVEVVALIETPKIAANSYAAFATANTCGAMHFHGSVETDSYDSRVAGGPAASTEDGGDVGTNGNLLLVGNAAVKGNLYTPRKGVGACNEGAVTALTGNIVNVTGGSIIPFPKAVAYPPPAGFAVQPPTNNVVVNAALLGIPVTACTSLGLTFGPSPVGNCTVSGTTVTIDGNGVDVTLPSVTLDNVTVVFVGHNPGSTVNINSLTGSGSVQIAANMAGDLDESVVLKVAGMNPDGTEMATPIDLSQMAWKQNAAAGRSFDSSALQVLYGGSGEITMEGGGNLQSAMVIYAPNATFSLKGTQDFFGSVLARTIEAEGNTAIHYDRSLSIGFYIAGQPMIGTFSWKRF